MKNKYIEREFPRYFIFGESLTEDKVDVASWNDDTIATVTKAEAEKLIKNREELLNKFIEVAQALNEIDPEAFDKIWFK